MTDIGLHGRTEDSTGHLSGGRMPLCSLFLLHHRPTMMEHNAACAKVTAKVGRDQPLSYVCTQHTVPSCSVKAAQALLPFSSLFKSTEDPLFAEVLLIALRITKAQFLAVVFLTVPSKETAQMRTCSSPRRGGKKGRL